MEMYDTAKIRLVVRYSSISILMFVCTNQSVLDCSSYVQIKISRQVRNIQYAGFNLGAQAPS
jgi:hypothetical protein